MCIRDRRSIDRSQKEYYLREQMRAIEKELGEKDHATEMDELRRKAEQMPLSEQARQKVNREIDRLSRMQASSPEASVSRTYIDTILELPWGKYTQDDLDLTHAEAILHEDHFGLEKVKERVLEYLSVVKLKPDSHGPIPVSYTHLDVYKRQLQRLGKRLRGQRHVYLYGALFELFHRRSHWHSQPPSKIRRLAQSLP